MFVALLACLSGGQAAAQASKGAETKAIHLGLVSEINKTAIEEQFRDFVGYVSRRISPGSESDAKVIITILRASIRLTRSIMFTAPARRYCAAGRAAPPSIRA
jgi:hypothetical protein